MDEKNLAKQAVPAGKFSSLFINPSDVNQTTIQLTAHFPQPEEFKYFAEIKSEGLHNENHDGLLDGKPYWKP